MSFTRIIIVFQLTGVPLGAENVAPAARAVTVKKFFRLHPVGVGVAEEAVVVISSIVFVEDVRFLFVSESVVARPTSVSLESCSVYVLLAVFALVKNDVNVFATLRSPIIQDRNVCTADQVLAVESVVAKVVYVVFVALSPELLQVAVPPQVAKSASEQAVLN